MEKAPSASASASRIFITALAAASACAAPNAQVRQTPEPETSELRELREEIAAMREGTQRLTAVLAELERSNLEKGICGEPGAADKPCPVDRSVDDKPSLENLKRLQKAIKRDVERILKEEFPYTACDDIRRAIANVVFTLGGRSHGKPQTPCRECPEFFRLQPDDGSLVEWHVLDNPSSEKRAFHVWVERSTPDSGIDITAPNIMINGHCAGRSLTDNM